MDAEQETLVQGVYSGVFPVKCNHDRELLECILQAGRPFNYGLEVGSRAELLMAMSMIGRSLEHSSSATATKTLPLCAWYSLQSVCS